MVTVASDSMGMVKGITKALLREFGYGEYGEIQE